ncbi:MAG: response regulator [Deltaproteobacteria bacterium]|nr:response regulator [Deltaproteobacteria bacterium]
MGKKVLVVDDSSTIRQQVNLALSQAGFEVVEAEDGADGIRQLGVHPDVAMVICDVNMPRMNGLEMLAQLRGTPRVPPILMLTTEAAMDLVAKAKSLGAKGWMVKPFKPDQLVAAAKKLTAA